MPADRGGSLTRLRPLPRGVKSADLEPEAAPHIARGVAYGYLHPSTHARFPDHHSADNQQVLRPTQLMSLARCNLPAFDYLHAILQSSSSISISQMYSCTAFPECCTTTISCLLVLSQSPEERLTHRLHSLLAMLRLRVHDSHSYQSQLITCPSTAGR